MRRKSELYLKDILQAIHNILDYTAGVGKKDFSEKQLLIDAVLRNLEIIGEAATNLPDEVYRLLPKVPWRQIRNFRVIVAHKYWSTDIDIVWEIIENRLEPLKKEIERFLNKP